MNTLPTSIQSERIMGSTKATHVLYAKTFIAQSALPPVPPFHGFALCIKLKITVHQEDRPWFLLLAGQCCQQRMPFVATNPTGKTLSRGFAKDGRLNTGPHMVVEAFGTHNLAMSVLIALSL